MENEFIAKEKNKRDIYGSFVLAGMEFAISVKSIQEIINEPERFHPIPLSPNYLVGLFNLRGMIIPAVDLSKIFDLDNEKKNNERKIAIIEHGQFCVGLLFDGTGDVFDGNREEKSNFNAKGNNDKESIVQGVFKLDDGKRIVQILDPYEVLNLKQIPQNENSFNISARKKKAGKRKQCISFFVGDSLCAINIDAIQEIIEVKEIGNSAFASEICIGAIDIRGSIVPIVNLSNLLGYEDGHKTEVELQDNYKIIVMRIDDEKFGFLVKSIENIISYYAEDLIDFPVLGEKKKELFKGCISNDEIIETVLLDHEKILSNEEISLITRGHSELYKEEAKSVELISEEANKRKSYITFSLDNDYALEISEVKEVIDYPTHFIQPPNLLKHFKGLINLRGNMVATIDLRALYNMESDLDEDNAKVLIFEFEGTAYGIIVDSIDSIISFTDKNKVLIPEFLYRGGEKALSEDVKEAVQVNTTEGLKKTFLVLNLPAVSSRIGLKSVA